MELEFDKEIDAILRGAAGGDAAVPAGDHIDADAASLFAENLLPEPVRAAYMRHFADCTRCRKLLSGVIVISSEAVDEPAVLTAHSVAAVRTETAWYKRLFAMPNLAYLMGGLILVFGGFIAVQVLQNSDSTRAALDVGQVTSSEPGPGGPNLGPETPSAPSSGAANAASSNRSANTTANSAAGFANTNSSAPMIANRPAEDDISRTEEAKKLQLDGLSSGADRPAAAQPPPPPPVSAAKPDDNEKTANDRRDTAAGARLQKEAASTDELKGRAAEAQTMKDGVRPGGPTKSIAGPSRNQQRQFPNSLNSANTAAATRKVGGRSFEYNDGVWYDAAYRGRPTVNVRRGSDDFRKLDEGLRSIAAAISGTIVVVWKNKSYRID